MDQLTKIKSGFTPLDRERGIKNFVLADIIPLFKKLFSKGKCLKGFSVIELVVGVTVFSVVVAASLGLFGSVLRDQRAAFAIQALQNNARFVFEFMAKEIRTGDDFSLNGSTEINFINTDGEDIVYRLVGTTLERSNDDGVIFLPVTADEVDVTYLNFELDLIEAGPKPRQPFITIMMRIEGAGARAEEKFNINLQTSISQRVIEIQ